MKKYIVPSTDINEGLTLDAFLVDATAGGEEVPGGEESGGGHGDAKEREEMLLEGQDKGQANGLW